MPSPLSERGFYLPFLSVLVTGTRPKFYSVWSAEVGGVQAEFTRLVFYLSCLFIEFPLHLRWQRLADWALLERDLTAVSTTSWNAALLPPQLAGMSDRENLAMIRPHIITDHYTGGGGLLADRDTSHFILDDSNLHSLAHKNIMLKHEFVSWNCSNIHWNNNNNNNIITNTNNNDTNTHHNNTNNDNNSQILLHSIDIYVHTDWVDHCEHTISSIVQITAVGSHVY